MFAFRCAVRTLLKSPGFFAIAVATIALGIAANTAIFGVVNGVLLRPLPFRDGRRVVKVSTATRDETDGNHSAGDSMDPGGEFFNRAPRLLHSGETFWLPPDTAAKPAVNLADPSFAMKSLATTKCSASSAAR